MKLAIPSFFLHHKFIVHAEQRFRERPSDTSVIEGQTAYIRCSIDDLTGRVQWTKGGLTMGYDRSVPGYPRYTVIGREEHNEYDLMITDVSIEDDDEFQCQVGPGGPGEPSLQGIAKLTVLGESAD